MVDQDRSLAAAAKPQEPLLDRKPALGLVLDARSEQRRDVVQDQYVEVSQDALYGSLSADVAKSGKRCS